MGFKSLFASHPTFAKAFLVSLFIVLINALTINSLIHNAGTGAALISCSANFTTCNGLLASGTFYWNIFLIAVISLAYDFLLSKSHKFLLEEAAIGGLLGSLFLSSVSVLQPSAYIPLFIVLTILMLIAYIVGSTLHKRRMRVKS